jgi:hypothetical protein
MPSLRAQGGQTAADRLSRERVLAVALSTPLIGALISLLTWPLGGMAPAMGPDPSWATGLYLAFEHGLHFGTEVVFTYGPLGFLEVPGLQDSGMWMLAIAYQSFIHVAVAISLLWAARRALPLLPAAALCYVTLVISPLEGAVLLLVFIWCVTAVSNRAPSFAVTLVAFAGGSLATIELLGKANFGISVLVFCGIAVLGSSTRRRNLPWFAGIVVIGFLALWFGAGQGFSNLPDFASNSFQVISGYSRAMSNDVGEVAWQRSYALATMAFLFAGAVLATRRDKLPQRIASLALVALFGFFNFKQGFVRQGPGSTSEYFVLMLGGAIALAWRLPEKLGPLPSRAPAAIFLAPLIAIAIVTLPLPLGTLVKPDEHLTTLGEQAHAFVSRSERDEIRDKARAEMLATYRLGPRILGLIGDRPVHIDPWEISVIWAYRLNWRPLPVVQDYSAFTPALDHLNARALSTPKGPSRILRQNAKLFIPNIPDSSIDGRYSAWDPPAATLAMLCHYRAAYTTERWQVLDRVPNRCGPSRLIGTVKGTTDQEFAIPAPPTRRDIVFARIHGAGVEGWEKLRSTLYRARQRTVTLDGYAVWRLVPDTAGDGLIMRAPKAVDFPEPFQLAFNASTLSVQIQGVQGRPVSIEFFAQRVGR